MRIAKKAMSAFLAVLMALGAFVTGCLCIPVSASNYQVGDVVKLGSYPQTLITDGSLISALNAAAADWQSYGYYSGTGDNYNGAMTAKDYMQYCDVTYGGAEFRGVKFTQYRPNRTGYGTSADNSEQDENGYTANTTYWFRYEMLRWRVLDPSTGLVLCDSIIDSQAPNNYVLASGGKYYGDAGKTHYANNYAESSLRAWLNDDFYNTAFTAKQKDAIMATTLDNSAYSTFYSNYDSASTTDNVFLLSYRDATNPAYSFSNDINGKDTARQAVGTDYAKCQGLTVAPNGNSPWWLRSAGYASASVSNVHAEGYLLYSYTAFYANYGVRPAITVDLDEVVVSSVTGDVVELGSYPQTRITDSSLISSLNASARSWQSYGYYSGTGDTANGAMTAKDYMQYCDVTLDGAKYRGVKFTQYRPNRTGYSTSAGNSDQDENGYVTGTTYWFRYDPLRWRVLDPTTGLAVCETIIDSQPVNNYTLVDSGKYYGDAGKTHYANNYAESSLRAWLNDAFYTAAFTQEEQAVIMPATLDNSAYSTNYSNYDSVSTTDNVFLLSYRDMQNMAYYFSTDINAKDPARQAKGTDYAKCQGLNVAPNGNSPWWLRSAGYTSASVSNVHTEGYLLYNYSAFYANYGVRPAIMLDLSFRNKVGDIVEFGSYPQTLVRDNNLIAELNNAPQTWKFYNYFDAKDQDNIMPASECMQYCDVTLGGAKYRGVKFTAFRSSTGGGSGTAAGSYMDDNGYALNAVYWFLYEPLQWRVLDPDTGLAMCEMLIDAQPYHYYYLREKIGGIFTHWGDPDKTDYANDYEKSSIRAWLNDDFWNAAFTPAQKSEIAPTTLDNSAFDYTQFSSASTTDAVFLLSRDDLLNTAYGFYANYNATQYDPAPAREAKGTDYAKCQGLRVWPDNGCSNWLGRTAGRDDGAGITVVDYNGGVYVSGNSYNANSGVRPAVTLDLDCIPFENYKTKKNAVVDAMAQAVGSDACLGAFQKAKDDIDAIVYDKNKTMDENKAAVDAVVASAANASVDHDYSDPAAVTFADDYSYATEAFECKNCGNTVTLTDSELDFIVTTTATCIADTAGQYKAEFNRPAVLGGGTDSILSDEVTLPGTASGHSFEWVIDTQETCSTDGVKHEECSVCHTKQNENTPIPATGDHTFEWVIDTQATCVDNGVKHEECSVCHLKQNENTTIPATGVHSFVWVIDTQPTCGTPGVRHAECTVCHTQRNKNTPIPATGNHTFEWVTDILPTCGQDGSKHEECTVCHMKRSENTPIPATGNHTFEWVTDTHATCGTDGSKHEECSVCHTKQSENTPIPATGVHTFEWVTDTPATCGEDGSKHEECAVCHAKRNENTPIAATGLHDYSVVNEKVEPTCTEGGYTTYKCSVCGLVDPTHRDEVGALGHDFGEWEIVRNATSTENGEKKRTCARCGATETAEIGADGEPILVSSADGQSGSALSMTVPYARRGAVITQLTAKESVTYTSSDPKLVAVDENGNVTFKRLSIFQKSATITATAENGKTATCRVTIKLKWWQYIIWFLFGFLWF